MTRDASKFGAVLRKRRSEKGFTLRAFAALVGVSPTYVSQVEQCNIMPPTADRVKRMANLLDANSDEWTALAGRVPEDLAEIFHDAPVGISELLRAVRGLTLEQLRRLRKAAEKMKKIRANA